MNHEIIDRVKATADHVTTLAEQYGWQSAVIRGEDAAKIGPALMQMAINELLRAELIESALVCLGYLTDSIDAPKEPILIGKNAREMLWLDEKTVRKNIILCENVLACHPQDGNTGCPIRELFEELRREEQKQLYLLEALMAICGKNTEYQGSLSI